LVKLEYKHEFNLGWVKREKVRRHPVSSVREKRTVIVGCRFEGFRRRERYVELSDISIELVIVSGIEWIYKWAVGVLWRLKRMGPRTEPWGMPEVWGKDEDERPDAVIMKERDVI
jgi:hypothetical protein